MPETFIRQILNPSRLAALRRLGLLDTPAEKAFDRLGDLAARVLSVPIALVTLVDDTRQFFKSCRGLPEPWASWRESPLSYSFCQHVLASTEPLVIADARNHPAFASNLALKEWSVIAYLGIPLVLGDGLVLGSFCVIDTKPRAWTADDVETVSVLARAATTEIELRSEMKRSVDANHQLASANEDLKAFTYSVAHDLRSHLQRLRAFTEILQSESATLPPSCVDSMQAIARTERQISTLFDGLLNAARASTLDLRLRAVDLSTLARDILAELRGSDRNRQVESVVQDGLEANADPVLVRLLLQNLLGNAWKFTAGRTGARIEFTASECDGSRQFTVRDNGSGFPAELAGQLFQPFRRLHTEQEFPGSGLGLHGAKRIVERHGGSISAEGAPGEGATFHFTLERPRPASTRTAALLDALAPAAPPAAQAC